MLKIKKIIAAILSLSTSVIMAGTMGNFCPLGNVSVPCDDPVWGFSVQGLYLQPLYNADLAYDAGLVYDGLFAPDIMNNFNYHQVKAQTGWGFRVEGSYLFETGNDLTVNWSHFSNTVTRNLLGNLFIIGIPVFVSADSKIEPQWNAVNIEAGQFINFGDFEVIRFHAGLAAVQFKRGVTSEAVPFDPLTLLPVGPVFTAVSSSEVQYKGGGPRIGVDLSYHFGNGFSIYGNSAGALFIGKSQFTNNIFGLPFPIPAVGLHGKKMAVVPELEAKIGITYTYEMAQGDVTLDVGYMAVDYFNALQGAHLNQIGNTVLQESQFAFTGMLVGLKWIGVA
jgi:hypothetical protein